jgi:hypothetical protein
MTSPRVSRGFHRLGLFLAAIPLLWGVFYSLGDPLQMANHDLDWHQKVACAHGVFQTDPKRFWTAAFAPPPAGRTDPPLTIDLQAIGCSSQADDALLIAYAENPPAFNWWTSFGAQAGFILAFAGVVSLAVYGVVRAIGWVIGGFASS